MASRIAERSSASVRPTVKPVKDSLYASKAAVSTPTAVGVKVWPLPQRTPVKPMTMRAADVVSSVP